VVYERLLQGQVVSILPNIAVGQNTLGAKLKTLSQELELSKMYTNHCLRATTITLLDENGFEARHIMSISGHKSESVVSILPTWR
jgi:integrase